MERATREVWAKRVKRWQDSGLTAKEFAAELDVSPNSLTFWKWKLRRPTDSPRRVRKRAVAKCPDASPSFLQLVPTPPSQPTAGHLEVVLAAAWLSAWRGISTSPRSCVWCAHWEPDDASSIDAHVRLQLPSGPSRARSQGLASGCAALQSIPRLESPTRSSVAPQPNRSSGDSTNGSSASDPASSTNRPSLQSDHFRCPGGARATPARPSHAFIDFGDAKPHIRKTVRFGSSIV